MKKDQPNAIALIVDRDTPPDNRDEVVDHDIRGNPITRGMVNGFAATKPYPTRPDCEAEALTPAVAAQPQPVAEQGELPQAMLNAFLGAVPEFTRDQVDHPNDEGRANWRALEDDAVLANCIRAAIAASQPHDADAAKRLRLICKLVGIESHVPADDETLWGAAFAVLGQIRAALEARQQAAEPVAWLSAVASCVSSGHATTEAAKHLLMVIESDGLPKFPAIQQPQPAVEREIPVGEKGWRPACCDRGASGTCCDSGCAADIELAELARDQSVAGVFMPEELNDEMRAVLKEIAPKWNAESIYANLKDAAKKGGAA